MLGATTEFPPCTARIAARSSACIVLGGTVVLVYSVVGGMWSITLAEQAQFFIETAGIFFLMLCRPSVRPRR
ncbi:putative Na+/solute symporter [Mobilicoccus pelagius NBRC 104925]|uniref:Putative Na+/solute symporter n=1 Tax=Mobilicoccus pelagius NBRC 104925 TaxID=1089455 RepID=H5URD2_9MICO|nr:putative Na+/solute symporter [Mobilicoccus pelagius NBRC 104925]